MGLVTLCPDALADKKSKQSEEQINDSIMTMFAAIQDKVTLEGDSWVITKVVEVPNTSSTDIYSAATLALSELLKDANDVIKEKDKETGNIVAKLTLPIKVDNLGLGSYKSLVFNTTISIAIKDNRYRIKLTTEDGKSTSNNNYIKDYTSYVTHYYPYWKDCKPKNRLISFETLQKIYNVTSGTVTGLEASINKRLKDSDW